MVALPWKAAIKRGCGWLPLQEAQGGASLQLLTLRTEPVTPYPEGLSILYCHPLLRLAFQEGNFIHIQTTLFLTVQPLGRKGSRVGKGSKVLVVPR